MTETFSKEDLVEVSDEVVKSLPDGIKIVKEEATGKYYLFKDKKKSKVDNEDNDKELLVVEDTRQGSRIVLESSKKSMDELFDLAYNVDFNFFKNKNYARGYIDGG